MRLTQTFAPTSKRLAAAAWSFGSNTLHYKKGEEMGNVPAQNTTSHKKGTSQFHRCTIALALFSPLLTLKKQSNGTTATKRSLTLI